MGFGMGKERDNLSGRQDKNKNAATKRFWSVLFGGQALRDNYGRRFLVALPPDSPLPLILFSSPKCRAIGWVKRETT